MIIRDSDGTTSGQNSHILLIAMAIMVNRTWAVPEVASISPPAIRKWSG